MTFTKEHYVRVSKLLRPPHVAESAFQYRHSLILAFEIIFSDDNKRFSVERFEDAIYNADEQERLRYLARCRGA